MYLSSALLVFALLVLAAGHYGIGGALLAFSCLLMLSESPQRMLDQIEHEKKRKGRR